MSCLKADVMELADMQDLGSCAKACRFDSCHPQIRKGSMPLAWALFLFARAKPNLRFGLRSASVGAEPMSTGHRAPCHPRDKVKAEV